MTETRSLRPDARLVQLHAERGDPEARLADALAALEEADWGLLFAGEGALARQLAQLLGPGTLRVDGRLGVNRSALAEAGLAVADLHGDLSGARAVWLLEPDDRLLQRSQRAGVPILVDATLAPGGGWPAHGADYVIYRDGVTLSGHSDIELAALFGIGMPPSPAAPAPGALSVALALRDVATLPLRLARAARTVSNVAERLGGSARPAGPTALLLAPDAAPDTLNPLGGVVAAARHVTDGVLLTPGLQDTEAALALVRSDGAVLATPGEDEVVPGRPHRPERRDMPRRFERRPDRDRQRERGERPDLARSDRPTATPPEPDLTRFTFEAPSDGPDVERDSGLNAKPTFAAPQPEPGEESWEPEIVFSDLEHSPPLLTHTVSNGPDAPDQRAGLDVLEAAHEPEPVSPEGAGDAAAVVQPSAATLEAVRMVEQHSPNPPAPLAPDLPATPDQAVKEDPAGNLTDEQSAIYARLRDWRNAEAKRQEISRFIIASNASLAEIARRVPFTLEDLAAVKGMGKARLEKYGQQILAVVKG